MPNSLSPRTGGTTNGVAGIRDLESWLQLEPAEEPAFLIKEEVLLTATGKILPPASEQVEIKRQWEQSAEALGVLAAHASISVTTGCWSVLEAWRDDAGYSFIFNASKFGYTHKGRPNFRGIRAHRLAYDLFSRAIGAAALPPRRPLDHECRNKACCNPYHLSLTTDEENRDMQREAMVKEDILASGHQRLSTSGIDVLDELLEQANAENPDIIVSLRHGPHRIFKLNDDPLLLYAEREPDEVFDALKPPAPDRRAKKSRAKPHVHPENQLVIINKNKYKKRKRQKIADRYEEAMAQRS